MPFGECKHEKLLQYQVFHAKIQFRANKNDFKITVYLSNGEDENVLNMEPGDITVFDDATENAEYSVGVSADVEPYTGIALMIYNGREITYPPETVTTE